MRNFLVFTLGVVVFILSFTARASSNNSFHNTGSVTILDDIDKVSFRALECLQALDGAPAYLPDEGRYAVLLVDIGYQLSHGQLRIAGNVQQAINNLSDAIERTGHRLIVIYYVHSRYLKVYVPGALSSFKNETPTTKNIQLLLECESSIIHRKRKLGLEQDLITSGLYLVDGENVSQYYLLYPEKAIPKRFHHSVNALIIDGVVAFLRGANTGLYPIKVLNRDAETGVPRLPNRPTYVRVFSSRAAVGASNGFDAIVVGGIQPFLKRYEVVAVGYVYSGASLQKLEGVFPDWEFRVIDNAQNAVLLYNLGLVSVLLDSNGKVFQALLILPASGLELESERMKSVRKQWYMQLNALFQNLVER